MTSPGEPPRRPEVFEADDPDLVIAEAPAAGPGTLSGGEVPPGAGARTTGGLGLPTAGEITRGFHWGGLFLAAAALLASLAFALWFARFVSVALERQDWLGWTAFALLALMALALVMILLRELVGFLRLRRLGMVRADADRALRERDRKLERAVVKRIAEPLERRAELKWPLARLDEHARDVRDPGDLLRLTDRDLLMAVDGDARRAVAGAARRVMMVSAMSPAALITVGWVLIENLRLLRVLAALYGGRPGFIGTARLARMVMAHIIATGGVALTEDLLGQFLGQDLLRRLSRRLGEGVFNGALTARIGAAAIEVIRPLPFIEAPPVRARDFLSEILKRRG
jgi:putative membrane protein